VEDISPSSEKSKPPARRSRRKHHRRDHVKTGNIPFLIKLAIIVAVIGISAYALMALLVFIDQPSHTAPPPDSRILDGQ
jgi:hypothetical protein